MSFYIVDVESDGPIPVDYSMVCFGAVRLSEHLTETFLGKVKPISNNYNPDALAVSGYTRKEHLKFNDPQKVMLDFKEWIEETNKNGRPIFISDNNGYDFSWINWYFHHFTGSNPFGWSSRRIGDLYCGMEKNVYKKWKHLRKTKHDHNPVNDAKGNAEALLAMRDMGLEINI